MHFPAPHPLSAPSLDPVGQAIARRVFAARPGGSVVVSDFARKLLDDPDQASAISTLGLSDLATTSASALAIEVRQTIDFNRRILWGTAGAGTPTLVMADAGVNAGTSPQGHLETVVCLNGNITWVGFSWAFPADWDDTRDVGAIVRFVINGAGTANDDVEIAFRWGIWTDGNKVGSVAEESETRSTIDVSARAAAEIVDIDLGAVISGGSINKNHQVQGVIERNALAANTPDDYEDAIGIVSLTFYGTRKVM